MKCRLYQGPLDGLEMDIANQPPSRKVFTSSEWPMVAVWDGNTFLYCKNRWVGTIKATYEYQHVSIAGAAVWEWRP